MNLRRRHLIASALLAAAVALASLAISASATAPLKLSTCTKALSSPKLVTLTCGDGNTFLKGLKWSSFGGATAKAKGTFVANLCEPNCAEGKDVSYAVNVTASRPKTCKGGTRVYSKLALVFAAHTPLSISRYKTWMPGCPTG